MGDERHGGLGRRHLGATFGRRRHVAVACACALAFFAHTANAMAWVCARVEDDYGDPSGPALAWPARTIPYVFNVAGTTHLNNDDAQNTIRMAFSVWEQSTLRDGEPANCTGALLADADATTQVVTASSTDLTFSEGPPTQQTSVGYNYLEPNTSENVLIFRDDGWRYALSGPSIDIIALTTLTYNVITGDILDADIEFNTADFEFTTGDDDVQFDLMNTASHEIGHLLGFAHSTDVNATMYGSAGMGETIKRRLSCDDAAILWYRYPTGLPTQSCAINKTSKTCGMCAHAESLSYNAQLKVADTNNGQGGCNCQDLGPEGRGLVAMLATAALWRAGSSARRRGRRGSKLP